MAMIYTLEQLAAFSTRSVPGPVSERLIEFACGLTLLVTEQEQDTQAESDRVHMKLTCVCRAKQDEEHVEIIRDKLHRRYTFDAAYTTYDRDGRVCDRVNLCVTSLQSLSWKPENAHGSLCDFVPAPHWHQLRIVELECFVLYK